MIRRKVQGRKSMTDPLHHISSESRAVIEGLLHIVGALKSQPGFDIDAFDAEMRARTRELGDEMPISALMLKAAAAVRPQRRGHRPLYQPGETALGQ